MKKKTVKMGVGIGKMNLEDLMKAFVEKKLTEEERTVKVATLSPNLIQKFKEFKRLGNKLEDDIEMRVKELELMVQKTLKEEFSDKEDELNDLREAFWESTYEELSLNPDLGYTVKEGKYVYQVGGEDEEETELDNVFKFRH